MVGYVDAYSAVYNLYFLGRNFKWNTINRLEYVY